MTRPASVEGFWDQVARATGNRCWEWRGHRIRAGYGRYGRSGGAFPPGQLTHRIAWYLANGPIPEGALVRHKCDNPPCVNPAHLELGTYADNTRDMFERGRAPMVGASHYSKTRPNLVIRGDRHYLRQNPDRVLGSANPFAKLTEPIVAEMKALGRAGVGRRELASRFGVSYDNVRLILLGKAWRHVS